jgi:prepilin-type N-terminal cleavage/methylation domain-containing protein
MRNNKGFTLVELIIAMAVSTIVIGSIASFMYYCTANYRRTNEETALQMEAQTIRNQLENLILEADNVKFDPATDTLRIKQSNNLYIISLNGASHTLLFEKVPYGGTESGDKKLFGKYVEDLQVVDTGTGDTNNRIKFSFVLKLHDSTYAVENNSIRLRNRIKPMAS